MADCLFCKIINNEIPADKIYETEDVLVFKDLSPQAPVHFLIIPKKHISTLNDITDDDQQLIGKIYIAAKHVAHNEGVAEDGYRVVANCNAGAGQTVFHVHFHLLAGRDFQWPPG